MGDYTEVLWTRQKRLLLTSYVNLAFVIINVLVYLATYIFGDAIYEYGTNYYIRVVDMDEYYRLFTCMFIHFTADHLFSNMLVLLFIGANVEHDIGHIEYFILYIASGIIASIVSTISNLKTMHYDLSYGASGAVYGIMGAIVVIALFGRKKLASGKNFLIRVFVVIALNIYDSVINTRVDGAAHIGGLVAGIIITLFITLIFMKEYTMEEWV